MSATRTVSLRWTSPGLALSRSERRGRGGVPGGSLVVPARHAAHPRLAQSLCQLRRHPRCFPAFCFLSVSPAAAVLAAAMNVTKAATEGVPEDATPVIVLDRAKFKERLQLQAICIAKQHTHLVSKMLGRFTLDRPKVKHVISDPNSNEHRLILLAERIEEPDILEQKIAEIKRLYPVKVVAHAIDLDYKYFSVEQVLKRILPEGWKVPAAFETIGHIAHLNLTQELLPYRHVIATVFLDKNQPKIRTIVNKVGTISNEFRVPTWEILAGDHDLVTEVRQHNTTYRLDYGLVYWNSRLEFEHSRLSSQFQPGQVVLDMFAGIGPFALPAGQRGCMVFANDLNPVSVQYLKINSKINKVARMVEAYTMDAREFMRYLQRRGDASTITPESGGRDCDQAFSEASVAQVNSDTPMPVKTGARSVGKTPGMSAGKSKVKESPVAAFEAKPWEVFHHVVMNLPASGIEFLDVFQGLLSKSTWKGPMPRVHCYCFMRACETTSDVVKRAESILGGSIQDPDVWIVRDVAPNKIMLCISFDLPEQVAFKELRKLEVPSLIDGAGKHSGLGSTTESTSLRRKRLTADS